MTLSKTCEDMNEERRKERKKGKKERLLRSPACRGRGESENCIKIISRAVAGVSEVGWDRFHVARSLSAVLAKQQQLQSLALAGRGWRDYGFVNSFERLRSPACRGRGE